MGGAKESFQKEISNRVFRNFFETQRTASTKKERSAATLQISKKIESEYELQTAEIFFSQEI